MIKSCAVALLAVVLAFHDGIAEECTPAQFFGNTWMSRSGCCFEPADLENYIGKQFLNHGATLYDAGIATANGNYYRFEIRISELSCTDPPGELGECDLLVAVYDWQGILFRALPGPPHVEPCEAPRLIHSKIWHLSGVASYQAAATYYYENRNNYPAVFAANTPGLSPAGIAVTSTILVLVGLHALRRRPTVPPAA